MTDLPWAVHYDSTSSAFFLHQALGLLSPGATRSLGVHPYPLYESAGLLLWLPLGFLLARRLRSEGALLAFTAAFDLGLRGFIDGKRAMINVWWSVLGQAYGLSLFQWALLACGASLLLLGLLFERRARAAAVREPAQAVHPSPAASPWTLWLAFLGLCLVGWLSNSGQTAFLHRALLVALALCVPALAIPCHLAVRLRVRPWAGYALASLVLLVLGVRLETGAYADAGGAESSVQASLGMRSSEATRSWLYDVDHRRGVVIRVGNQDTPLEKVRERENMLGIPPTVPASQPPAPSTSRDGRGRTWVGGGFARGQAKFSSTKTETVSSSSNSDQNCSGGSTTYTTTTYHDRKAIGGWGEVEREIPAGEDGVFWIGGRAGVASGTERTWVGSSDPQGSQVSGGNQQAYYVQAWGEYETPSFALGLGMVGGYASTRSTSLSPGGHLRVGHPRFGVDLGYLDRMSFLGYQSGHFGVSFGIPRDDKIRHPDDVVGRIFVGAYTFPGARLDLFNVGPGVGVEIFATPSLAIGFDGAVAGEGAFGGLHLRSAFSP